MRAYLAALEKAERREAFCYIDPNGKPTWWDFEPSNTQPFSRESNLLALAIVTQLKAAAQTVVDQWRPELRRTLETETMLWEAAAAVAFQGADEYDIELAFCLARTAGVRLSELPTLRRILRHPLRPIGEGRYWDKSIAKRRAFAAAMKAELCPRIRSLRVAASAAISPETCEVIKQEADIVERFLEVYISNCEEQACQDEERAEAEATEIVGDQPITWRRNAPTKRRKETETVLFSQLCNDLKAAGVSRVVRREDAALVILRAFMPRQFKHVDNVESLSRRRRRAARQTLTGDPA